MASTSNKQPEGLIARGSETESGFRRREMRGMRKDPGELWVNETDPKLEVSRGVGIFQLSRG